MNRNTKGNFFLCAFKLSSFFTKNKILLIVGFPIRILYKIIIQWIFGIDVPDTLSVGKNLQVYHGQGLIINEKVIIGNNVVLRHNTTIGISKKGGKCPIILDNVNVGANSVLIGPIKIGSNSTIAAGSVVIRDVPESSVVAGNPARVIKKKNEKK